VTNELKKIQAPETALKLGLSFKNSDYSGFFDRLVFGRLMQIATLHFFTNKKLISISIWQCVKTNSTPVVHIKIAGKWMFIPLKMVLIGIDPYPSFAREPQQKLHKAAQLDKFRACSKATCAASAWRREKFGGTAGFCGICPEKAQKEQHISRSPVDQSSKYFENLRSMFSTCRNPSALHNKIPLGPLVHASDRTYQLKSCGRSCFQAASIL